MSAPEEDACSDVKLSVGVSGAAVTSQPACQPGAVARRALFVAYYASQLLLLLSVLNGIRVALYVEARSDIRKEVQGVVLELVTLLATGALLWQERISRPGLLDAALALTALALYVTAWAARSSLDMGGVACVEAACVLLNASRFYVRQVAFGEAMRWNELAPCDEDGDEQAAQRLGRVSTFGITLRACSVLVSEFPATNAAYLLCALLNAAQSPLVSLLVSRTVSAPPEQVDAVRAIGLLAGVIAVGQLGQAGMSALTARLFADGTVLLQRRLALEALHEDGSSGAGATRLTSTFSQGVAKVQAVWTGLYWNLAFSLVQLLIGTAFLCSVDVVVALIMLAFLPLMYSLQAVKVVAARHSADYSVCLGEQQTSLENLVSLRASARTMRAGPWLLARWDLLGLQVRSALFASVLWSNLMLTLFQAVGGYAMYIFGLATVVLRYSSGEFSQEESFAMAGYLAGLLAPIAALARFNSSVIYSAGPILDVLDMADRRALDESPAPQAAPLLAQQQQCQRPAAVAAADVVFRHANSPAGPTLDGLSLEVAPGELVALCGGSGSGKTTLLRLLGRALDDASVSSSTSSSSSSSSSSSNAGSDKCKYSGVVTVDGVEADDYQHTAFCLQHFEVLNGTIRDNIAFGCEHDSLLDVRAAARDAEIAHVIEALPHGYDTVIGSGSQLKLSGGQLARLGLARAICRRPRLLLLDEVTSALDPATEQQVLATLRAISRTRPVTIIMVTHSIFAAQQADRVVMLAGGRVAEQGKYQDLVDHRGPFWALARSHV